MREEIANLVHPVINYGLRLKERVERGDATLDLDMEQAALKGYLLSSDEARRLPDFGGDSIGNRSISVTQTGDLGRRAADSFLGIRYALVCWLDEIFIDSRWERDWNEKKLETQLYGTNLRADVFWEQAKRAEARPGSDALEVFFLCVMLGFRGELRNQPEKLQAWVNNTQARIARSQGQELAMPPEHDPPTSVPPRHGKERLQRMVLLVGGVALTLVFMGAILLVQFYK